MNPVRSVRIDVAPGELIDKITILEIKAERIVEPEKLANVRAELSALLAAGRSALPDCEELAALHAELREINGTLWHIEEQLRACDRAADFGPAFVELARSVYRTNDRRSLLKRRINELLGSELIEEKSYAN